MSAASAHTPASEPRYQPLTLVLPTVAAGIFLDRVVALPVSVWILLVGGALLAWRVAWRRERELRCNLLLALAVVGLSAAWHHAQWNLFAANDLGRAASSVAHPIALDVRVVTTPQRMAAPPRSPLRPLGSIERSVALVEVEQVRHGAAWQDAAGRARLSVDGHLIGIRAGDRLRIYGNLTAPSPANNPGEFDFARHARADRQLAQLHCEHPQCVTLVERAAIWRPMSLLSRVQASADRALRRYVAHESTLARAVLLGVREPLEQEQTEAFLTSGTIHLLSISGLHVGMLAAMLLQALRLGILSRRLALGLVGLATVGYVLLTGAEPPAVRAAVMVLIACGGLFLGRAPAGFNTLAAAALVVLALCPADLFRVGPQLSFLSVAALVWWAPRWAAYQNRGDALDRLIARTRPWPIKLLRVAGRFAASAFVISSLLWLVTAPLVMSHFHVVTPVALLLNPIVGVAMFVAMLGGFGTMTLGALLPFAGRAFGILCDAALHVIHVAVDWADAQPWSHRWTSGMDGWWLIGLYGALAIAVALPMLLPPRRWCCAGLVLWCGIGVAVPNASRAANGELVCTFISVGHGCSVLMELPDGKTVLYDAGRLGSPTAAMRSIASCLWSRGITHLDAIVISHADIDHYNAGPELVERFSVGMVYVSPVMFDADTGALRELQTALAGQGIPLRTVWAGDRLRTDPNCRIEVVHPPRRGILGSDNANSIVLTIEYAGRRLLLPGDLETPGLEDVMAEQPWDCDVLLAPHHGSRNSNPAGFARWCTPEYIVISAGPSAPTPIEYAAEHGLGCEVLSTSVHGAVTMRVVEHKLPVVETWRMGR